MTLRDTAWLLIIAVFALLISVPFILSQRERSRLDEFVSRGRLIQQSLIATIHFDTWAEHEAQWRLASATIGTHPTSTDFFRDMVTSGFLNVEFSFFSGMGVPSPKTTDPSDFTAQNNAWCIVSDPENIMDERAPVLFTKNMDIDMIGPDVRPSLTGSAPFGQKKWVAVTRGGAAFVLDGAMIDSWYLGSETHPVMRP